MKFQLNTTEWLDWAENWCFRCKHDHLWSHPPHDEEGDGCPLIRHSICGEDVPEFEARSVDWWRTIPAEVSCSRFELCTAPECTDQGTEERRDGETRRQFHDRLRAETLALPVVKEEA